MALGLELADGRGLVWYLTEWDSPIRVLGGIGGLDWVDVEPLLRPTSVAVHGRSWIGWRAAGRELTLPLFVEAGNYMDVVRDFAAGTVPPQPGPGGVSECVLTAVLPDTSRWTLGIRLVDRSRTLDRDPTIVSRRRMSTTWHADVFWSGPEWSGTWDSGVPPANWLLTSGGVAALGSSHAMAGADAVNDGDIEAWPVWMISGPCTAVSFGVGGRIVTWEGTLLAGQSLTVDTDPELGQVARREDGADVTYQLTAVDFAPLEPGPNQLAISMTGTGDVAMSYRPRRLSIL